jgi:predicted aldo/keto reductase-like oxidoreductase
MKRRDFLKTTALATAGIAGSSIRLESDESKDVLKVKKYRKLGKTGIEISDISFGTGRLASASMIVRAVDRGINYFDTAPDYGKAEEMIGEAMGKIQRDKVYITSKMCTHIPYPGHLPLGTKKKEYIASVEGSLARMNTDYIDFCFVHAMGEMSRDIEEEKKRLLDEEMLAAVEEMKKAGKIRFLGVSSHGPSNMEDLMLEAVNSGLYDAFMPAFNFMNHPRLPEVLKQAHKKGVGIVAMKTLAGAKDMELEKGEEAFEHAALKWALKHREVAGLVLTIKTVSDLDLFLGASGVEFTARDQKILDRYARLYGRHYCRTGCGDCEPGCPSGVQIANTLRYQMYFREYGQEKMAMESYAALKDNAGICLDCSRTSCSDACTYGLPIRDMLREAHNTLSFTT